MSENEIISELGAFWIRFIFSAVSKSKENRRIGWLDCWDGMLIGYILSHSSLTDTNSSNNSNDILIQVQSYHCQPT